MPSDSDWIDLTKWEVTPKQGPRIDLLQFQIAELTQAQLADPSESETLEDLEEVLADASEHIEQEVEP